MKRLPYIHIIILAAILIAPLTALFAQPRHEFDDTRRFFTGGGLGLQLGTIAYVDVSPFLGYFLMERWDVGLGVTYQYYVDKRFNPHFTADVMGGRIFTRYHVLEDLFLQAEYEILNYNAALIDPLGFFIKPERVEVYNYLIGAGYRQAVSNRVSINLVGLWNLNESVYSLYDNPVIRIGVEVGL
ncbi:MAG: hypothetical protein KA053_03925 [Lentimicrobiaceae bacterium]|nr:hypothetical protein [Lentimicrobiaceae bacterium]